MKKQLGEIRIYVACLAAYNNGHLHGKWIDAAQCIDGIQKEIRAMLKTSPMEGAEEYAVHDYEGFEGIEVHEYESLEQIAKYAAFISEHGKLGGALVAHFGNLGDATRAIEDHYFGEYKSVTDYAEEMIEQSVTIPEPLQYYVDYEKMAADLVINDIFAIELGFDEVHIFG